MTDQEKEKPKTYKGKCTGCGFPPDFCACLTESKNLGVIVGIICVIVLVGILSGLSTKKEQEQSQFETDVRAIIEKVEGENK